MKRITCSDLGGPATCDVEITGQTPEEMGKHCQAHVMDELAKGDAAHQEAVAAMQGLSPEEQQAKMAEYMKVCEEALKAD
mgnify:CR=1 FL=1